MTQTYSRYLTRPYDYGTGSVDRGYEAIREFLTRKEPFWSASSWYGVSNDLNKRQNGICSSRRSLVPRQQRFGNTQDHWWRDSCTCGNRFGLKAGNNKRQQQTHALTIQKELDTRGFFNSVTTLIFICICRIMQWLNGKQVDFIVLARQPIACPTRTLLLRRVTVNLICFSGCLPSGKRAGDILLQTLQYLRRSLEPTRAWNVSGKNMPRFRNITCYAKNKLIRILGFLISNDHRNDSKKKQMR